LYGERMSTPRASARLLAAATLGLGMIAACAGAAPAGGAEAQGAWTSAEETAKRSGKPDKAPDDAGAPSSDGGPRCPYGELTDPHRGFVRCLLPDERDAGWLPPPPQGDPQPPEPPKAEPPKPAAPPTVEIGAPKFENGQVTKVEKSLGKASAGIAKCVAEHGGLDGDGGRMKIQFLVRSRGRAEGVEVLSAKNVSREAASCVRVLLKNKAIGAPSADPVGVTVVITFKAPK
jgi:hypothetical protein